MELGYSLSSEEHPPADLVRHAVAAERAGFRFALISDHYHPWIDRQGPVVCGPHVDAYLEKLEAFANTGATHLYLHQIGPDQDGFLRFARESLLPASVPA